MVGISSGIEYPTVSFLSEVSLSWNNGTLIIVYQMGRLCGGAHEISGNKAQIFLHGWVGGGGSGGGGVGGSG